MMKLTTPATASEPYTADAPPVSTSTRSISGAGIWLMSARRAERAARRQTAAVDQHQRAVRAEVAQVERRGARRAVRDVAALVREGLRQLVDQVFDLHRCPSNLMSCAPTHGDGAGAFEVGLRNARTRDDDLLDFRRGPVAGRVPRTNIRRRLPRRRRAARPVLRAQYCDWPSVDSREFLQLRKTHARYKNPSDGLTRAPVQKPVPSSK